MKYWKKKLGRELTKKVGELMLNSSNYIKKKAVLAATRIIRKVPEMADEFIDKCEKILDEKHHGVLLGGLSLA